MRMKSVGSQSCCTDIWNPLIQYFELIASLSKTFVYKKTNAGCIQFIGAILLDV